MQGNAKRWTERVLSCVSKCFITYKLRIPPETNTVIQIYGKENKKNKRVSLFYVVRNNLHDDKCHRMI